MEVVFHWNWFTPYCPKIKIFDIYALYSMQQIFLDFVFMHNHAAQILIFRIHGHAKLHEKLPVFMKISWKKICLKFRIHAKFRAKKIYLFWMNVHFHAKLVSYWYKNDAEFRGKKSFCTKPCNFCARELTVLWKP